MSDITLTRGHESFFSSVRPLEILAFVWTISLIAYSIFQVMVNSTSGQVAQLITDQNAAALRLWTDGPILIITDIF
jgi:hypothetical protein